MNRNFGAQSHIRLGFMVAAAASVLALSVSSAQAADPKTFRDVEFGTTGNEEVVADQALVDRLAPRGAAAADVVAALYRAGAHSAPSASDGDLRFVYAYGDFADDMQRDISINVTISLDGGVVRSASVSRATYG